jgi:prophage regulatory protein
VDESRSESVQPEDRLLRLPEVLKMYPVSKSAWYAGITAGRYPPGIKLSSRSVAWRKSDIDSLIRGALETRG